MRAEEVQSLVVKKIDEGKDYKQINKEIKRLKMSQVIFKEQKSDLKKAQERISKLEEELKDLKKKNFNLNLQLNVNRDLNRKESKSKEEDARLNYIKRIMIMLKEENKPLTLSDFKDLCCTNTNYILPCLGLLEDWGVIKSIKDEKGVERYSLK